MVLILNFSLRIGCVFLHDASSLQRIDRMQYCAIVKRSFVCLLDRTREPFHRCVVTGNGHFRNFMNGISQKFRNFRSPSMLSDPATSLLLFAIILIRPGARDTAKSTRKWMYFFRHCPYRTFHLWFYTTSLPSSLSLSLFPFHHKRITFFLRVGDLFPETKHGRDRSHIIRVWENKNKDLDWHSLKPFESSRTRRIDAKSLRLRDEQNSQTIRVPILRGRATCNF